jgi:hypothetical protein
MSWSKGGEEEICDNWEKTALFLSNTSLPPGGLESKRLGVTDLLLIAVNMFGREQVVNEFGDGSGDSFGIALFESVGLYFYFHLHCWSSSLSNILSSDNVIASPNC